MLEDHDGNQRSPAVLQDSSLDAEPRDLEEEARGKALRQSVTSDESFAKTMKNHDTRKGDGSDAERMMTIAIMRIMKVKVEKKIKKMRRRRRGRRLCGSFLAADSGPLPGLDRSLDRGEESADGVALKSGDESRARTAKKA